MLFVLMYVDERCVFDVEFTRSLLVANNLQVFMAPHVSHSLIFFLFRRSSG